jgi:uracil-DNA glycosylase
MLNLPHVAPLTKFVDELRQRRDAEYPYFDPLDGGTDASLLFLFEKPGPMTAADHNRKGSGFISRDNDDPTAEATFWFMQQAGISRAETVVWNVVPGWNGTRKITSAELLNGLRDLRTLLSLLPNLRAIVLVGKKAARAKPLIRTLPVFASDHPSPLVRARYPERWRGIPEVWARAAVNER